MVKHIVMWKLRGESDGERQTHARRAADALRELSGKIPGMIRLEVGVASDTGGQSADLVLVTEHEDWQALATYRTHPEHQKVAALIAELKTERHVFDFEA